MAEIAENNHNGGVVQLHFTSNNFSLWFGLECTLQLMAKKSRVINLLGDPSLSML
jgi:hypothetical protein